MKKILAFSLAALLAVPSFGQKASQPVPRPKLVVGIVIDQMRYDYLYRYWSKLGNDGFKRLLGQGFSFESCHYNYVPTYTGPGHASIYTGATPSANGIIGNNWWERETGRGTYVTEDRTVQPVGGSVVAGQQSPRHLLTTTIGDELRLATNFQSKVIGLSMKDRGSILPAGNGANAAYWYDGENGAFISSTFYMKQLPEWVTKFNTEGRPAQYLSKPWETLLPLAQYTESSADDVPWESVFKGETTPTFPHDLPRLSAAPVASVKSLEKAAGEISPQPAPQNLDLIRSTPFGNSLTADFAIETLRAEQLGQRAGITDMLAVSFSCTDYVGHQFGANAVETEDTYLRLDRDLARLLAALDKTVGKGQALVFLTADHGAAHAVGFLQEHHLPGGGVGIAQMRDSVQRVLTRRHGPGAWVLDFENLQVYLNRPLLAQKGLDLAKTQEEVAGILRTLPGVALARTASDLQNAHWSTGAGMFEENGFYAPRSGDVLAVLMPGWLEAYSFPVIKGTTHGASWQYDTHVPLLFWGWHVKHGESTAPVHVVDIAATVARFLHIQEPSGCSGVPLAEVLKY
ncbi:alkaline phosphatase family protein [Hymenobacter sp. BT770]|uniref:alkaline phosphatase PafA n=1 Tax=Hymenobacter sp. BT770 TaxID=2886942 RepID=UPI001D1185CF|nr:alkaline phosphatase PafA [Hymenobacter sp. BT770]MCC3153676.1 alkaline phosphatase family protein [Hymenobacter sp. BT770]MDO3415858.1 alkaline phosphatase family protein [Hymenobacter sp. BT770]